MPTVNRRMLGESTEPQEPPEPPERPQVPREQLETTSGSQPLWNNPVVRSDRQDRANPLWTRVSSGYLCRDYKGYRVCIFVGPAGFYWTLRSAVPILPHQDQSLRLASPVYREVWRSSHSFPTEDVAVASVAEHLDAVIERLQTGQHDLTP
jgi:hypothetical protein